MPQTSVTVTFRHLDATPALTAYAQRKLAHAAKFLKRPCEVHLILTVDKYRQHGEVTVKSGPFAVTAQEETKDLYSVIEVSGLDRPGLLYQLTTAISKLNLNIASAHVATFGERVVDVFYITDLTRAQIATTTRQAAIKRALLALFTAPSAETKPAREPVAG